jgi:hypothetical protein
MTHRIQATFGHRIADHRLGYVQPAPDILEHYQAVLGGRYLGLECKLRDARYDER